MAFYYIGRVLLSLGATVCSPFSLSSSSSSSTSFISSTICFYVYAFLALASVEVEATEGDAAGFLSAYSSYFSMRTLIMSYFVTSLASFPFPSLSLKLAPLRSST